MKILVICFIVIVVVVGVICLSNSPDPAGQLSVCGGEKGEVMIQINTNTPSSLYRGDERIAIVPPGASSFRVSNVTKGEVVFSLREEENGSLLARVQILVE